PMIIAAANTAIAALAMKMSLRRPGLLNSLVALGAGCGGSTVVGAVPRLMLASVRWGRMLVWTSLASAAVSPGPASSPRLDDSLTSVVPSTRQYFSASSVSTRLHVGQRFIL